MKIMPIYLINVKSFHKRAYKIVNNLFENE